MCRFPAKYLLCALLFLNGYSLLAQTSSVSNPRNGRENNPYTKFGIGELQNGNNTVLRGMGNCTSAFESPYVINTDNPASYSFLARTTFEASATGSIRTVKGSIDGADASYRTGTASISHLTLAFPVGKKSGLSLGFKPYTHVYYSLADTIPTSTTPSPIGSVINSYNGDGALNYAFIGGATRIKGLSLGFNVGYLFGTIRNTAAVIPHDSSTTNNSFNSEFSSYTRIGGIQWKGGLLYEKKLDSAYSLRVGATVTLRQNISERFNTFQISSYNFGDTTVRDTIYNPGELRGNLTLPLSYSIGVMLSKNDKWGLGIDYAATQWSTFNSLPDSARKTWVSQNAYRLSLGGELTPDVNNIHNYWSRATYRMGIYYGTEYLAPNNTTLPCYGITLGCSLPFKRSLSHVHIAFDMGSFGTTSNNLMKQNYFRFTLGMSLNDLWFVKRRYE